MFEEENCIYNTQLALSQQQSSQSIYAVYQGADLSWHSSFTLPICHMETQWTSTKPFRETFPEVNLLISQLATTKTTFYHLLFQSRAVQPLMTLLLTWVHRTIHYCSTVKVNTGLLLDVLITGTLQWRLTRDSKHLSPTSPANSINSAHLCCLLYHSSNLWP